jgi:hypothetical protein
LTDADQTISNAITLAGSGADLSITVDNSKSLTVQAALTTSAGDITLSADDDVIFTVNGDISSTNGNILVTADDDGTDDAGTGGALTMVDGTVFDGGSGTITGVADEDITLGQMTTTNATSTAITLNTTSGNILDGDSLGNNDLTAASGTVALTIGGNGTFGTTANPIEITSATTTGIPEETPIPDKILEGSDETVGEASVDQTINIVQNVIIIVQVFNLIVPGSSVLTVFPGINTGPFIVNVYSQSYALIKLGGADPQIAPALQQLNNLWLNF